MPPAARPQRGARPIPTPFAPRHKALTTSVPLLMPPSTKTSSFWKTSEQYLRISSRVCTAGGAVSAALPPSVVHYIRAHASHMVILLHSYGLIR